MDNKSYSEKLRNLFKQRMGGVTPIISQKDLTPIQQLENCRTFKDLQSTYRILMNKYHPDKSGDSKENLEMTQSITEKFTELKVRF